MYTADKEVLVPVPMVTKDSSITHLTPKGRNCVHLPRRIERNTWHMTLSAEPVTEDCTYHFRVSH